MLVYWQNQGADLKRLIRPSRLFWQGYFVVHAELVVFENMLGT